MLRQQAIREGAISSTATNVACLRSLDTRRHLLSLVYVELLIRASNTSASLPTRHCPDLPTSSQRGRDGPFFNYTVDKVVTLHFLATTQLAEYCRLISR